MVSVGQKTWTYDVCTTHLTEFLVVMSLAEEELERFLASLNRSPRQRRISLGVRIRVTHVGALYEPFHEE